MTESRVPAGASLDRPTPRHFLDLCDFDAATLRAILDMGKRLKADARSAVPTRQPLEGRTLALLFERNSTRTRVSFEVGMRQLGGNVIVLDKNSSQLQRGETIADTARVLSRYVDAIMLRTDRVEHLQELANHASVPVINGLTNVSHPCQIMADVMTVEDHRGPIAGKTIAWVGDGNNVACSWIKAAAQFGFALRIATPQGFEPDPRVVDWARAAGGAVTLLRDPTQAVAGAHAVVTDTWTSMADDPAARDRRVAALSPYQVTPDLMAQAAGDALFLHCLPAHRGEEVTDDVIDGPWSVVWDEAENRLHAQKGILVWCLT